jgi:hypothetical protein
LFWGLWFCCHIGLLKQGIETRLTKWLAELLTWGRVLGVHPRKRAKFVEKNEDALSQLGEKATLKVFSGDAPLAQAQTPVVQGTYRVHVQNRIELKQRQAHRSTLSLQPRDMPTQTLTICAPEFVRIEQAHAKGIFAVECREHFGQLTERGLIAGP